ncbi:MAG: serine--tRNA ligase, partial [Yaniella sp.]|nr:serine--tRNA ligase [Yaniella sp.]
MIDVKHLAENPDLYRASQRAREDDESLVDQIITADADRRAGGEENFAVLKEVGDVPQFEFEPRAHLELGELLGAIDMERGAKVSGSRFYFLKGVGAQLEMALTQMGMAQAAEAGFTPIITPTLVRPETMNGTGFNVEHDDEIYRIEK